MKAIEIFLVDAFTKTVFKGNPAAICILPDARDEGMFTGGWMQLVAGEMNLSETVFLTKRLQDDTSDVDGYNLRWFTPTTEVSLCGHATLGAAHILWEREYAQGTDINFNTKSGVLIARSNNGLIELDFPADPVTEVPAPPEIARAIGAKPIFIGKGQEDYLIEVGSEEQVRSLSVNAAKLKQIPSRGFIVTAKAAQSKTGYSASSEGYDFVSRFFAPSIGIDEDPVTGSAHCTLAGFWGEKLGKTEMTGYQASVRGGFVNVTLKGDVVTLGGHAVTVYAGLLEG